VCCLVQLSFELVLWMTGSVTKSRHNRAHGIQNVVRHLIRLSKITIAFVTPKVRYVLKPHRDSKSREQDTKTLEVCERDLFYMQGKTRHQKSLPTKISLYRSPSPVSDSLNICIQVFTKLVFEIENWLSYSPFR
jgi:hypothetical protein